MTFLRLAAFAALLVAPAAAQTVKTAPNPERFGTADLTATCVTQLDGTCVAVSATGPLPIGGKNIVDGASFTRPADTTAYASGDLVANSTTAGSVTPVTIGAARSTGGTGYITGVRLSKTSTGLTNAGFRVHLFRGSPTVTGGDNAAFVANGIAALHICYVDITMDLTFSDGAKGAAAPARGTCGFTTSGSANIYALVEARAAYTPASAEVFNVAVEADQN